MDGLNSKIDERLNKIIDAINIMDQSFNTARMTMFIEEDKLKQFFVISEAQHFRINELVSQLKDMNIVDESIKKKANDVVLEFFNNSHSEIKSLLEKKAN